MYERESSTKNGNSNARMSNSQCNDQATDNSAILSRLDDGAEVTEALQTMLKHDIGHWDQSREVKGRKSRKSLLNTQSPMDNRTSSILIKRSQVASEDYNEIAYKFRKSKEETKRESTDPTESKNQRKIALIEDTKGIEKLISDFSSASKIAAETNYRAASNGFRSSKFLNQLIQSQAKLRAKLMNTKKVQTRSNSVFRILPNFGPRESSRGKITPRVFENEGSVLQTRFRNNLMGFEKNKKSGSQKTILKTQERSPKSKAMTPKSQMFRMSLKIPDESKKRETIETSKKTSMAMNNIFQKENEMGRTTSGSVTTIMKTTDR